MQTARLWNPLRDGTVQCRLCAQFCVIRPGKPGLCGVRVNSSGTLETMVYDKVAAMNLDPVEKKPLYHFLPGSMTFSFGTMGCNVSCSFCQNADLSQTPRTQGIVQGRNISPEELVELALSENAQSISYTYSEPTIFFELMEDTTAQARKRELKNILVSNGFQSPECLDRLQGIIDAANIDLKAFSDDFYRDICNARLDPVLQNLKRIFRMGWWLEVTTLIIPGANDSPEELRNMARFLRDELSPSVPWHLSGFHPTYRMTDRPPTPPQTLFMARDIAKEEGLSFVYLGNLPGGEINTTMCPSCNHELVRRKGFTLIRNRLNRNACPDCGTVVPGVWSAAQ